MTSSQAKINYDMSIDERMDLFETHQKNDPTSVPLRISSIANLPVKSFKELKAQIKYNKLIIKRFTTRYSYDYFKFFATSNQIRICNLLSMSLFVIPILSILLVVFFTFWWILLLIAFPIALSSLKNLYNHVILYAALESEKAFCFLYNSKIVSLVTPDFEKEYWKDADSNKNKDDSHPHKKKKTVSETIENRKKYLTEEKHFAVIDLGTRKAPIKPSQIQFVSMIMAFAWKHAGMSEQEALEYAVLNFVLMKDGTEQEKKDAKITADSAFQWSFDQSRKGPEQSLEGTLLQLECGQVIKDYLLNPQK